jgi:hypothetical protein
MSITIAVVIAVLMFALGMSFGAMLQQAYSNNTQKILYQAYREARDESLRLERKIATGESFKRNVIRSIRKISD